MGFTRTEKGPSKETDRGGRQKNQREGKDDNQYKKKKSRGVRKRKRQTLMGGIIRGSGGKLQPKGEGSKDQEIQTMANKGEKINSELKRKKAASGKGRPIEIMGEKI